MIAVGGIGTCSRDFVVVIRCGGGLEDDASLSRAATVIATVANDSVEMEHIVSSLLLSVAPVVAVLVVAVSLRGEATGDTEIMAAAVDRLVWVLVWAVTNSSRRISSADFEFAASSDSSSAGVVVVVVVVAVVDAGTTGT